MTKQPQYHVIGAGGHAKVIIRALQLLGHNVVAVFDDDPTKHGSEIAGVRVVGCCDELRSRPCLPTVIGVGDNRIRRTIANRFDLEWATVVHPRAIVDVSATIARGSVVMAGAIIQADCVLGEHCIVNTGATVDHDCVVEDYCHVAPGVNVAGHCHLGEGVMAGIGACFIPSTRVGEWTTIGAGATVVSDLPANVTATGTPARPR